MGSITGVQGLQNLASVLSPIKFPWQMEYEADLAGIRYMNEAGYDIDSVSELMKRLQAKYGSCNVCSHPPTSLRLQKIKEYVTVLKASK